jgi:hypothetical protein
MRLLRGRLHDYRYKSFFIDGFAQMPYDSYFVSAVFATVLVIEEPAPDIETKSFHDHFAALGAVSVLKRMARNITQIYIVESRAFRHLIMSLKCLNRGGGKIHHFVIWMESKEVYRSVRPKVIINPRRELLGGT